MADEFEVIQSLNEQGKILVTPMIDVTANSNFETIRNEQSNGKLSATPVYIVGGTSEGASGNLPIVGTNPLADVLSYNNLGQIIWKDGTIRTQGVIWVNEQASVGGDGTLAKPYTSINLALANLNNANVITVENGIINENVAIGGEATAVTNLLVSGSGIWGVRNTRINRLSINGSTQVGLGANNISVENIEVADAYSDTSPLTNLQNVEVKGTAVVSGRGNYTACRFQTITFNHSAGNTNIFFRECKNNVTGAINLASNMTMADTVDLLRCSDIPVINHAGGILKIVGSTFQENTIINSSCLKENGKIILQGVDNKTLRIVQTGDCDIDLYSSIIDIDNSTIIGLVSTIQLTSEQVVDENTRTEYVANDSTVKSHLDGINATLNTLNNLIDTLNSRALQHFTHRRLEKFGFAEVPIAVNGGSINLLSLLNPATDLIEDDGLIYTYSGSGNTLAVKFPYVSDKPVRVCVKIRINGRSASTQGFKDWTFRIINNVTNAVIEQKAGFKGGSGYVSTDIDRSTVDLTETLIGGINSQFIRDGVRVELRNPTDATMYITGVQITTELIW